MNKKIYFVTGNKNKVEIFNKVMQPEYAVTWFEPEVDIPELTSISVKDVVVDKVEKAYLQFNETDDLLFVTDVGIYIHQLDGRPGALIKRETKKLFDGNFTGWCNFLDSAKTREAYVQMIIVAKNLKKKIIIIDHKVNGYIPLEPLPGEDGFAWDEIFVPSPELVSEEHKNKSFAQIPEEVKFQILVSPAIKKFKQELNKHFNEENIVIS
ncbi:hypothetical protein KAR26_03000 [Candidatus Parcubacteria bacterium]|nr:hypothetical protein [Candidatus Parcubacteria bacterium]